MSQYEGARPIIFGEVLFDVFGPGQQTLGGAPFNVAWNLRLLGADPLFISRIGDDDLGKAVLAAMEEIDLDSCAVQIDETHPTGVVRVEMDGDDHTFDILTNQAYDYIEAEWAQGPIANHGGDMLYHGTLAARSQVSSRALKAIKDKSGLPVFVDVNLRPPWSDGKSARDALKGARWGKLNDVELFEVLGSCRVSGDELDALADYFRTEASLDLLVLTMGAKGAILVGSQETWRGEAPKMTEFIDSVGAGDAFTSVTILGLSMGWDFSTILDRASAFASCVCGIRGATTTDRTFYEKQVSMWSG